jgi:hypothetical protein
MKKVLTIALLAIGFIALAVPESKAGVSIGIGFGFPAIYGYPAYPYGYGCYPYGYYPSSYSPYSAAYYQPVIYYSAIYGPYYWWHGHRVYLRHRHVRY